MLIDNPLGMSVQEFIQRRLESAANLVHGDSAVLTLLNGIHIAADCFPINSIHFGVVQDDILPDVRVPTRKFTFELPIDVPRINEEKIGLLYGTV
jgi:hypothetical protein